MNKEKVARQVITVELSCENVDCSNTYPKVISRVKLKKEFDNESCWWCGKCQEKDKEMIERKL